MAQGLHIGFELDRQWHRLRGEMEASKQPALSVLAKVFAAEGVPYAVIGGVALQVHLREPRTTLDIDLAVTDLDRVPREALRRAGFAQRGRHAHSENWVGPEGTPVQITGDPALHDAVLAAEPVALHDFVLRVLRRADLLHAKLRSGTDPARRRSKRLQDLADVQALLEADPSLDAELRPEEKAVLERLPR